mgnify:CR=1 FL=1
MVTPTSRRAFLVGRRTPATPFEQFCARLTRMALGTVRIEAFNAASGQTRQAWLKPLRPEDVAHARALCREYGVALALDGGERTTSGEQATLWVSPQTEGAAFSQTGAQTGVWRADAGCTVAQLKETGLFDQMALEPELTLAQWFAWPAGTQRAHDPEALILVAAQMIERVEVLLADGTVEVLGPFGANSQAPLRSLTVQRLVPKLFELAASEAAQRCAQLTPWPARYRLNALMATPEHEPNLARLLVGHQGRLGWVQTLWLKCAEAPPQGQRWAQASEQANAQHSEQDIALASHLDQELKHILDPFGVFGSNSNLKGLESAS